MHDHPSPFLIVIQRLFQAHGNHCDNDKNTPGDQHSERFFLGRPLISALPSPFTEPSYSSSFANT